MNSPVFQDIRFHSTGDIRCRILKSKKKAFNTVPLSAGTEEKGSNLWEDVEMVAQQEGGASKAGRESERERELERLGLLSWGDKIFSLSNV